MIDVRTLLRVEQDFRPLLLEGDQQTIGTTVLGWSSSGLTVRIVRGRRMRTEAGVYDEFAAALQFPLYFGENRDAFHDCITDLEEGLPPGEGYVVVVTEPDQVLVDEPPEAISWLVRALKHAAEEWARPIALGEWWDRPPIPFHLVLAGKGIDLASRRWTVDQGAGG
ncbi:barstar family protein [Tenggerimyces flavus]|uniref:Barstar family protein n=1 Tax=Tenggerimyces flavus TaxID=1708749 RepID=A0ABV7Y8R1_9ACTN|nr:barstar family protein [Tenggerimyces flavus]MBM7785403.1 hypothetical protein [Tenggerimyces flavus]